jgi:hypothetical protein
MAIMDYVKLNTGIRDSFLSKGLDDYLLNLNC